MRSHSVVIQANDPIVMSSKSNGLKGSNGSDQQGASHLVTKKAHMEADRITRGGDKEFEVRANSSSENGSSEIKSFHWVFEHTNNFPVADDSEGISHLPRHCKYVGCQMPAVKNLAERETYVEMAVATGKVILWSLYLLGLLFM